MIGDYMMTRIGGLGSGAKDQEKGNLLVALTESGNDCIA